MTNISNVAVCKHILKNPCCAKYAFRLPSDDYLDSGWQFICDKYHKDSDVRYVSVNEITVLLPSVLRIIHMSAPSYFELIGLFWKQIFKL